MRDTSNSELRKKSPNTYKNSQFPQKGSQLYNKNQMPLSSYRQEKNQSNKNQGISQYSNRTYQRAPSSQFKKYLDDDQNIFW